MIEKGFEKYVLKCKMATTNSSSEPKGRGYFSTLSDHCVRTLSCYETSFSTVE